MIYPLDGDLHGPFEKLGQDYIILAEFLTSRGAVAVTLLPLTELTAGGSDGEGSALQHGQSFFIFSHRVLYQGTSLFFLDFSSLVPEEKRGGLPQKDSIQGLLTKLARVYSS